MFRQNECGSCVEERFVQCQEAQIHNLRCIHRYLLFGGDGAVESIEKNECETVSEIYDNVFVL